MYYVPIVICNHNIYNVEVFLIKSNFYEIITIIR